MATHKMERYEHGVWKFTPDCLDKIVEVGARGGTITQMALAAGVVPSTLKSWMNPQSPRHIPAVAAAVELGMAMSQAVYETIGLNASQGLIKNHAGSTYAFMMKNLFKDAYSDEMVTKHLGAIEVGRSKTPQEAEELYKTMLSNPDARAVDVSAETEKTDDVFEV